LKLANQMSGVMFRLATSRAVATATRRTQATIAGDFEYIIPEVQGKVGIITLNRPKALNALCDGLIDELNDATQQMDRSDIRAIVITGSKRAFAAGADIKEMKDKTFVEAYKKNMFAQWAELGKISTPTIAAVSGFALGGGCELAMLCDFIIASESAKFGQPEITLGVIPGCGGTQRLVQSIGKSKAMEMILTGSMMSAHDAEKAGLVARVVSDDDLLEEAMKTANKIARFSKPVAAMAKEAVNASYEGSLSEGLHWERRLFHSCFATNDQKTGMNAFVNKEKNPVFTDS